MTLCQRVQFPPNGFTHMGLQVNLIILNLKIERQSPISAYKTRTHSSPISHKKEKQECKSVVRVRKL